MHDAPGEEPEDLPVSADDAEDVKGGSFSNPTAQDTTSNILKKQSDTAQSITQNLK